MDDPRLDTEASGPGQGPHWLHPREPESRSVVPLRLVLQPSGPVIEVDGLEALVGRHSAAAVRLPLPDVSRRHCRFVWADGYWQVIDLNSLNGTFVNGIRVDRVRLEHRDQVRIGSFTFEINLRPGEHTVQLPRVASGEVSEGVWQSIADALPQPEPPDEERRAS